MVQRVPVFCAKHNMPKKKKSAKENSHSRLSSVPNHLEVSLYMPCFVGRCSRSAEIIVKHFVQRLLINLRGFVPLTECHLVYQLCAKYEMNALFTGFFLHHGNVFTCEVTSIFFPRPVKNQLQLSWDYPAGIFLSFLQLHILVEALRTCIITRYSCAAEVNSTVVTRRCCYTPFAVAVYHCFRGFAMFTCSRRLVILLAIRPAGSSAVGTPATFSTLLSQRGVIASAYLEYLCEVFTNYITKQ